MPGLWMAPYGEVSNDHIKKARAGTTNRRPGPSFYKQSSYKQIGFTEGHGNNRHAAHILSIVRVEYRPYILPHILLFWSIFIIKVF